MPAGRQQPTRWILPSYGEPEQVRVDIELDEGPVSLIFKLGSENLPEIDSQAWQQYFRLQDGSIYLSWNRLFEFLISPDGRKITGRSLGGVSREAFQTYLFAQVLSFALIRQGVEPFHCTAVVSDGKAVGFLGDCGYGKSSLAAAFLTKGYRILTDDLLVLKEVGQDFLAIPSFPRIKLFPEAALTLLGGYTGGTPMNPFTQKLIFALRPEQICQTPVPFQAFFVLRPPNARLSGKRITIRTLHKRRACFDLIANTFNSKLADPDRQQRLLSWASRLANRIPVKSLSYPRDLSRLPEVAEAVLRNLDRKSR